MRLRRAVVLATVGLSACDLQGMATKVDVPLTPYSFDEIQASVLLPSCMFGSCHSRSSAHGAGGLNLETDSYAQLMNVPADNGQAAAANMMRVAPCDPSGSFLVVKLELPESTDDPTVGYGAHMPERSGSLPAATLEAIRAWIARGAPQHEEDAKACSSPDEH